METISVHDLVMDRMLNPRLHGVDQDVVEFYAGIFKEVVWPPILVHRGTKKLLDGWHRVEAAKRAGVYELPVQWVEALEEDIFAYAVKANLGHGVRLTREERYRAIARLQREAWSPERIVDFLGCSAGMVDRTEKAEDLRIRFKVQEHPAAVLPTETLVEITRLPQEYYDEIAELACEVDAAAPDVRRTVRAIKKGEVERPEEIRRIMTDPEYAKLKKAAATLPTLTNGEWMLTFATLLDQMERAEVSIPPLEREAAVALFRRLRTWADQYLVRMNAVEPPPLL